VGYVALSAVLITDDESESVMKRSRYYFEVLSQHMPTEAEKNHGNLQDTDLWAKIRASDLQNTKVYPKVSGLS
jgi:hypothetical protein